VARYFVLTEKGTAIPIYDYRVKRDEVEYIEARSRTVRRIPSRDVHDIAMAGWLSRLFSLRAPRFTEKKWGTIGSGGVAADDSRRR
jgi:hypothetical protein